MSEPIKLKKKTYSISEDFLEYLQEHSRHVKLPLSYHDLLRFEDGMSIYDDGGIDTLWLRTFYPPHEQEEIHLALKKIYSILHADGSPEMLPYLNVDAIDFCTFGNTKPFRVKVRNVINDNYVYFYIKLADASRIYGLELEEILSPNQINFLIQKDTLIEEHISGIPGDVFMDSYLADRPSSEISAIAKEFVKFNERCFVRLLGDMRAYNYVVVLTNDFDRIQYRFRAIDFDQQSYEGDSAVYRPSSFKENKPMMDLIEEVLPEESIDQYKKEERALIAKRASMNKDRLKSLISCMKSNTLSLPKHVDLLRKDLYSLTGDVKFKRSKNMGELIESTMDFVVRNY
ncbi:MAG: hypothetical protein HKO93_04320, partial [Flavobacteriales bacterium]|nr:hypothetical protein [Flavobacteriales bacterium]